MTEYVISTTTTYRVPTVQDALDLRDKLQAERCGELTGFSYATKYVKKGDEILEEYQAVKVTRTFNEMKDPDTFINIKYTSDLEF